MITNQPNIQELEKDVILLPEETSTGLTDNKQQEVEEEAIDENKSYDVMAENQQELNPSTEKLLANSYYFKLIASLPPTHTPAFKPKGGVQYLYEAETLYKIDDWRDDGYHWRQQGSFTFDCEGVPCKKMYFYTNLGKLNGELVLAPDFKREAYLHPDYPLRVLVRYVGDASIQVDDISSKLSNEDYLQLIKTLNHSRVPKKPEGGYHYLYEAKSSKSIQAWQDDKWQWVQKNQRTIFCGGVACKKITFYTNLGKVNGKQALTADFKREAFIHPDYPLRVLVRYVGDASAQKAFLPKRRQSNKKEADDTPKKKQPRVERTKKEESTSEFFGLIKTLNSTSIPKKPEGGVQYVYEAQTLDKIDDWRDDGWHWRQQGSSTFECDGFACKKMYFYTNLGKIDGQLVLSSDFKREAYLRPDYPLRVFVRYVGDSSIQKPTDKEPRMKRARRRAKNVLDQSNH